MIGPVGPGGAADQLEPQWLGQPVQQRQAIAEGDRLDVDPVLIDQAVGGERAREAGAAEDDDVLARLALELGDLLLSRSVADARVAPLDVGERAGEHDFRQRVHELAGRALRARPRLRHVLAAPAAEDEHAGLAEQLGYRALAMGAVRLLLAEPVHGPVAASGEAVQRHRHVEDELALRRLAAHASSFHPVRACEPSQNGLSAERPQRHR